MKQCKLFLRFKIFPIFNIHFPMYYTNTIFYTFELLRVVFFSSTYLHTKLTNTQQNFRVSMMHSTLRQSFPFALLAIKQCPTPKLATFFVVIVLLLLLMLGIYLLGVLIYETSLFSLPFCKNNHLL